LVCGGWQLAILQGTQIRVGIATVRHALHLHCAQTRRVRTNDSSCNPRTLQHASTHTRGRSAGNAGRLTSSLVPLLCCALGSRRSRACCYNSNELSASLLAYSPRNSSLANSQGPTTIAYIGGQKFAPTLCAFGDTVNTVPAPHLYHISESNLSLSPDALRELTGSQCAEYGTESVAKPSVRNLRRCCDTMARWHRYANSASGAAPAPELRQNCSSKSDSSNNSINTGNGGAVGHELNGSHGAVA
jgi:hypothetical protein